LGLPYAFASHFAPAALTEAVALYRERFTETPFGSKPRFMLAINVIGAPDDDEARFLFTSAQQAFARLRMNTAVLLPPPVRDLSDIPAPILAGADAALAIHAIGGPDSLREQLAALIAAHQPDEVILTSQIHDHAAWLRSYQMAADALREVSRSEEQRVG